MFYTVYRVTNNINGKFYIGTHKTKDINDSYHGSGTYTHQREVTAEELEEYQNYVNTMKLLDKWAKS